MKITPEWKTRGKAFELAEIAEWQTLADLRVTVQQSLKLQHGRRGRIDILIEENDAYYSIIEVKATNWDDMAGHRVRPNILRLFIFQ